MSRFLPDADAVSHRHGQRGSTGGPVNLLACLFLLVGAVPMANGAETAKPFNPGACPVSTPSGGICINGKNILLSARDDSWSLDDVELRDVRGTRVVASRAKGIERGGLIEMDFSGQVHVEFRGALLDADTAHVVLRDESLVSVDVKGSQAKFSHQPDRSKRRIEGQADSINYVTATGVVQFRGNTFYTNGVNTMRTPELTYNINTQEARAPNSSGTIRLGGQTGDRVPPPRTPDRSTAQ